VCRAGLEAGAGDWDRVCVGYKKVRPLRLPASLASLRLAVALHHGVITGLGESGLALL
jgi:hypothetical protein